MNRIKKHGLWIIVGAFLEIAALVMIIVFGNRFWPAFALVAMGFTMIVSNVYRIQRAFLNTKKRLEESLRGNEHTSLQGGLFADEINGIIKNYRDSISHVNLETAYRNTQLEVLMSQINPHFLYNTLESIRGQALFSDDHVVADMAETLSNFFRYCISRKGSTVRIKDELRNVNIYLKIMGFRFPQKFSFHTEGDYLDLLDFEIPKLTLQPIVENAIMHGIMDYSSGGDISLRIINSENSIKIYIRDNGIGMNGEEVRRINEYLLEDKDYRPTDGKSGLALYNINRRIKRQYGSVYGVRVFSTEHFGTNVMVYLPKILAKEEVGI